MQEESQASSLKDGGWHIFFSLSHLHVASVYLSLKYTKNILKSYNHRLLLYKENIFPVSSQDRFELAVS